TDEHVFRPGVKLVGVVGPELCGVEVRVTNRPQLRVFDPVIVHANSERVERIHGNTHGKCIRDDKDAGQGVGLAVNLELCARMERGAEADAARYRSGETNGGRGTGLVAGLGEDIRHVVEGEVRRAVELFRNRAQLEDRGYGGQLEVVEHQAGS